MADCADADTESAADQFHACPSAAFFATLPESSVHAVPSRDVPPTATTIDPDKKPPYLG
jgi:hypothetical protein